MMPAPFSRYGGLAFAVIAALAVHLSMGGNLPGAGPVLITQVPHMLADTVASAVPSEAPRAAPRRR